MTRGRGIFITATDTGVGKTFVGAGIAGALRRAGVDVGVMKPAETGCPGEAGNLTPRDALTLLRASGADDSLDLVNPYRFREPLAPMVAAEREEVTISPGRILTAFRALRSRHDFMIVEGAGGIMVPLSRRTSYLDLARAMGLPVVIVARPDLGTLNHTRLTVLALRSLDIPVSRIIVNCSRRPGKSIAERTNPAVLQRLTRVPVSVIPYECTNFSALARSYR